MNSIFLTQINMRCQSRNFNKNLLNKNNKKKVNKIKLFRKKFFNKNKKRLMIKEDNK